MRSFVVVYMWLRCWVFFRHATPRLWLGTIVVCGLHIRCCSLGIIGQPFTKRLTIWPNHLIGAIETKEYLRAKNSPWILFWWLSYFSYGALTWWSHLWVLMGWSIFFGWLTMCWNRWKQLCFLTMKKSVSPNSLKIQSSPDLAHLCLLLVMVALTFVMNCSMDYWRNMVFSICGYSLPSNHWASRGVQSWDQANSSEDFNLPHCIQHYHKYVSKQTLYGKPCYLQSS